MAEQLSVQPNMQAIIIANAIALVLLCGLFITSRMARSSRPIENRMFAILILVCVGACIAEPLTWFVDGNTEPWAFFLNYAGNTYCYLANIVYAYLWVLFTDVKIHKDAPRIRQQFPVLFIPGGILALLILFNLFGHYFFVISDANIYSRTPLSYVCYCYTFACLFFSIYVKKKSEHELGHKFKFFPMPLFLVPVFVGAALQAVFFGLSLSWPSVCIGLVLIQLCLQNELSYIDALTNVYNRAYLEYVLQSAEQSKTKLCGIMLDLDYFKDINDTYGHFTGDEALRETAKILTECEPPRSQVFRFAGDEFVMLTIDGTEETAQTAADKIESKIRERNEQTDKPYQLSLSSGTSTFSVDEGDTADAFMKRIDARMYDRKRAKHAAR